MSRSPPPAQLAPPYLRTSVPIDRAIYTETKLATNDDNADDDDDEYEGDAGCEHSHADDDDDDDDDAEEIPDAVQLATVRRWK